MPLILFLTTSVYGQDSSWQGNGKVNPYFGLSVNFSGEVPLEGFGIEAGAQYRMFYIGAEYGIYGFTIFNLLNGAGDQPIPFQGEQFPDRIVNQEQYYGFHAGITIIKNSVWLGIAFLWSSATMYHPAPFDTAQRGNSGFEYILHVFNIGPDIRFTLSDYLTLNFAYTNRRGLKIGMAYIL